MAVSLTACTRNRVCIGLSRHESVLAKLRYKLAEISREARVFYDDQTCSNLVDNLAEKYIPSQQYECMTATTMSVLVVTSHSVPAGVLHGCDRQCGTSLQRQNVSPQDSAAKPACIGGTLIGKPARGPRCVEEIDSDRKATWLPALMSEEHCTVSGLSFIQSPAADQQ
jgi:hypothetical protein